MFRAAGLDFGHTETRAVSVGLLWGAPIKLDSYASFKSPIVSMPSDRLTIRTLNVPDSGREIQGNVIREENYASEMLLSQFTGHCLGRQGLSFIRFPEPEGRHYHLAHFLINCHLRSPFI